MEVSIEQMNEAIALFDGWALIKDDKEYNLPYYIKGDDFNYIHQFKFHSSWDRLMPICHVIREKAFELKGNEKASLLFAKMNAQLMYGTIADVHLKAYEFIQWLNKQKEVNNG
jgi:hypothetical protein